MDVYAINSPRFSTPIAEMHVLNAAISPQQQTVITVGFFDGVHRGHQHVLQSLRKKAQQRGLPTVVVTFAQHPRSLVRNVPAPPALTTLEEKITAIAQCGIDAVAVLNFSPEMARLTAQEFMQLVLCDGLGAEFLLMGYDHRFGRPQMIQRDSATATPETFEDYVHYGVELGIEVVLCDKAEAELQLSSSSIRLLLEQGNVNEANALLGRSYAVTGTVVQGFQNGRKLGFPTANLQVAREKLVPHLGSYATWVHWRGARYAGMTNIGQRPTLDNGTQISIEAHLLDFQGDLYSETLTLEFVNRLRDEKRFDGLDALKAQLAQDAEQTRQVLANH